MLARIVPLLLAALMPRGQRPPLAPLDTSLLRAPNGIVFPKSRRGGASWKAWRETIAALRSMPIYANKTERNAAKRARRALRAKGGK